MYYIDRTKLEKCGVTIQEAGEWLCQKAGETFNTHQFCVSDACEYIVSNFDKRKRVALTFTSDNCGSIPRTDVTQECIDALTSNNSDKQTTKQRCIPLSELQPGMRVRVATAYNGSDTGIITEITADFYTILYDTIGEIVKWMYCDCGTNYVPHQPWDVVEILTDSYGNELNKTTKQSSTVDLSMLQEGDTIVLNNGDKHIVNDVRIYSDSNYYITTFTPRVGCATNNVSVAWNHDIDGIWIGGYSDCVGNIVDIKPKHEDVAKSSSIEESHTSKLELNKVIQNYEDLVMQKVDEVNAVKKVKQARYKSILD